MHQSRVLRGTNRQYVSGGLLPNVLPWDPHPLRLFSLALGNQKKCYWVKKKKKQVVGWYVWSV